MEGQFVPQFFVQTGHQLSVDCFKVDQFRVLFKSSPFRGIIMICCVAAHTVSIIVLVAELRKKQYHPRYGVHT